MFEEVIVDNLYTVTALHGKAARQGEAAALRLVTVRCEGRSRLRAGASTRRPPGEIQRYTKFLTTVYLFASVGHELCRCQHPVRPCLVRACWLTDASWALSQQHGARSARLGPTRYPPVQNRASLLDTLFEHAAVTYSVGK